MLAQLKKMFSWVTCKKVKLKITALGYFFSIQRVEPFDSGLPQNPFKMRKETKCILSGLPWIAKSKVIVRGRPVRTARCFADFEILHRLLLTGGRWERLERLLSSGKSLGIPRVLNFVELQCLFLLRAPLHPHPLNFHL